VSAPITGQPARNPVPYPPGGGLFGLESPGPRFAARLARL